MTKTECPSCGYLTEILPCTICGAGQQKKPAVRRAIWVVLVLLGIITIHFACDQTPAYPQDVGRTIDTIIIHHTASVEALNALLAQLCTAEKIKSIERHHEQCPGPSLDVEQLDKLYAKGEK